MSDPWPEELRLARGGGTLNIRFDSGQTLSLDAEYLRVESPSAEVKGHGPGQEQLVSGKRQVTIRGLEPVGSYAVKIIFSDGHDTGLYTWQTLYELGTNYESKWRRYLERLAQSGESRSAQGGSHVR